MNSLFCFYPVFEKNTYFDMIIVTSDISSISSRMEINAVLGVFMWSLFPLKITVALSWLSCMPRVLCYHLCGLVTFLEIDFILCEEDLMLLSSCNFNKINGYHGLFVYGGIYDYI